MHTFTYNIEIAHIDCTLYTHGIKAHAEFSGQSKKTEARWARGREKPERAVYPLGGCHGDGWAGNNHPLEHGRF